MPRHTPRQTTAIRAASAHRAGTARAANSADPCCVDECMRGVSLELLDHGARTAFRRAPPCLLPSSGVLGAALALGDGGGVCVCRRMQARASMWHGRGGEQTRGAVVAQAPSLHAAPPADASRAHRRPRSVQQLQHLCKRVRSGLLTSVVGSAKGDGMCWATVEATSAHLWWSACY